MKKTKIICTLGPATDNDQVLADMIKAGMDVARFNFSHGDYDAQSKRLEQLIRVREAQGVPVATLLDTKGPEIRTGDFEDPNGVVIHKGDTFTLTTKKCLGDAKHCYVNYQMCIRDRWRSPPPSGAMWRPARWAPARPRPWLPCAGNWTMTRPR